MPAKKQEQALELLITLIRVCVSERIIQKNYAVSYMWGLLSGESPSEKNQELFSSFGHVKGVEKSDFISFRCSIQITPSEVPGKARMNQILGCVYAHL